MHFLKRVREPGTGHAALRFCRDRRLAVVVAGCAGLPVGDTKAQTPKNIIIIFADGVAPTQWDFGRYSSTVLRQQPFVTTDLFRDNGMACSATQPARRVRDRFGGGRIGDGHRLQG